MESGSGGSDKRNISQKYYDNLWHNQEDWDLSFGVGYERARRYRCISGLIRLAAKRVPEPLKALELGCGRGDLTELIREQTAELTAMDISLVGVAKTAEKELPRVNCLVGSAIRLPFRDRSFNLVVFSEVIEHIEDQRQAMTEIARVLKPGGLLILTTPNPAGLYYLPQRLRNKPFAASPQILNLMISPSRLDELFSPCFGILKKQGFCYLIYRMYMIRNRFAVKLIKFVSEAVEILNLAPRKGLYQAVFAYRNGADAAPSAPGSSVDVSSEIEKFYAKKWENSPGFWSDVYGKTSILKRELYIKRNKLVAKYAGDAGNVLDLGAGIGDILHELGPRKLRVGIEMSYTNARRGRDNLRESDDAFFMVADGARLPFRGQTFDAVALADVIEHIPNYFSTLKEIHRVLRPGGKLICVTPNPTGMKFLTAFNSAVFIPIRRLRGKSQPDSDAEVYYENFISGLDLKCAFEAAGFRIKNHSLELFHPSPEENGIEDKICYVSYRIKPLFNFVVCLLRLANGALEKLRILNSKQFLVAEKP